MRMDNTSKDDSCMLNGNTEQLDSSCRGKGQASLRIQRCHSDGVLINGCLKSKVMSSACKSSSESSMEGRIDSVTTHSSGSMTAQSIGSMTTHSIGSATNGTAGSNHTCTGFDNDLSPVGENRESLTSNCGICDNNTPVVFQGTLSIDGYDVVRPKTWSRRVVEKRKDQMKGSKKKSKMSENKNLEVRLNGLDIKTGLNAETTVYSRNVCDTYRQEADVIFGRTRGGTRRNIEPLVCELPRCLENGIDTPANKNPNKKQLIGNNSVIVDNVEIERLQDYNVEHQSFLAPLAMPEDFSDEEAAVGGAYTTTSQITSNLSQTATATKQGCACADSPSVVIVEKPSENGELTQIDEMRGHSLVVHSANSSQTTENVLNGAHCTNRVSHTFENNTHEKSNKKNGYSSSDRDNVVRNYLPLQQNEIRPSRSSSLESIDDIGDFIEADLPPNVERLAFFSRGSSDEDEGCGDEMLPNDDGGEESENETIDPLVDYRRSELLMHNNTGNMIHNGLHQGLFDNSNLLSDPATLEVDNDSGDDIFSNVILNDDGEQSLYSASGCSTESRSEGNSANSKMNSNFNTMPRSRLDRNSGSSSLIEDSNCVCCDRQVDVRYQRTEELGVIVCDNCFNELDFVGNKKFDNVVRKKSRTLGAGSSLSASLNSHNKLVHKNNNFLLVSNNSQEKVNNNSVTSVQLSSNESEPFERLYVSDSSEMVSPDGDTGAESVFQSSSATSSDGTFVQYMQMSLENSTTEEDTVLSDVPSLHHQASSQDYNNVDEQLYCPYLTHRSRSLDHELSECDTPNISVTSSNFQEDESNNQEKVFEKHAYDVDVPIPTCSSSDEEENTRVPDAADETEVCASHISPHHESVDMERMLSRPTHVSRKVRGQSNDLDEEEPIYEDIDDLEVLLLEVSNDGEPDNRSHAQPLCNAISKLRRKRRRSPTSDIEKVMLWYEYEAYVVQVKQIGTSACGPTAVLNVLKAFDFQVEKDEVTQTITSNLRMEAAPIPYYLFSRYSAGTTAQTLVEGVAAVTRGAIKGRFFHFYPQRDVELLKWLGHWMKKGAVPVATLNLQKGVKPGWTIPDAWHHQMVYGVSSKGVYLTNPLEIVPEKVIMEQLSSDSVLLVRRQDVVSRFRDWCPLNETLKQRDPRWCTMNVLGQIVHMLREQCMPQDQLTCIRSQLTSHICIPAAYKAGIILFMRTNSDIYEELLKAPELPLKNAPSDT